MRVGKILRVVEDKLGKYEAEVLLQVVLFGHARVNELIGVSPLVTAQTKDIIKDMPNGNGDHFSNGTSVPRMNGETPKRNVDSLLTALERLAEADFIQKVRSAHFRNDADNRDEAERHVSSTQVMINAKGKKMQEEFDMAVDREIERRKESTFPRSTFHSRPINGLKRTADSSNDHHARKRSRLADGVAGDSHDANEADIGPAGDIIVQVNHSKFSVLMRNQRLVSLAEQTVGRPSAKVYRTALRQVEHATLRCRSQSALLAPGEPSDHSTPYIDVDNLVREVDPAKIQLGGTVAQVTSKQNDTSEPRVQPVVRRKRPPDHDRDHSEDEDVDEVDEHGNISEIDHDSEDEAADRAYRPNNHRLNGTYTNGNTSQYEKVMQHLHLLAEAPEGFLTLEYDGAIPSWQIDYDKLSAELRNQQLFSIIFDRFGNVALRLVRVMMKKGKLDEKSLQEIALMSAKDLRQTLAMLKAAGFLELQEVPRENQRQPSRTIYLWFYDADRVRRKVIEDLYKTMARILVRLKVERKKIQGVLDKADRTDVKGHEEELLSSGERQVLYRWRNIEEAMWGEVGRLDDLVTILRDF